MRRLVASAVTALTVGLACCGIERASAETGGEARAAAHFLDHYVIRIFPTVVIGLEAVYGRSYGELLVLSTAAFTAFGLFALPAGWLADKWSRRNMIALYFLGTGICCVLVGVSESFETLAVALFGVGLFAAIYHPVGTPMIVDAAVVRGRTMAFNGICGNIGRSEERRVGKECRSRWSPYH